MITEVVSSGETATTRSRASVLAAGARRWFGKESTLVVFTGLALSVLFHLPMVLHPKSVVIGDLGDPLLQAWEMAWNGNFLSMGSDFWTSNMFYPAKENFAFTDSLLGYLPLSLFGEGQYAAVLRYNIAFLFAFTLAFVGCYLLTRQLGGNWQAAALAGVVMAWAPWRQSHINHLNILSTGGIALALFAIARGHGYSFRQGMRPELARPWWAFAGWAIAAWQVTIGFATGIPFVYVMGGVALVVIVAMARRRHTIGRRLPIANGVGLVVFLGITYLMAVPYLRVVELYHFQRSWDLVKFLSPYPVSMVGTSNLTWLWRHTALSDMEWMSDLALGEKLIFPGLILLLFGLVGVVVSVWPRRVRIGLAIGAAVAMVFSFGGNFFGGTFTYYLLWAYAPGWDALRTPGRLIIWTVVLLALLAAGAITRLTIAMTQYLRARPAMAQYRKRLLAMVLVLPAVLAMVEGIPEQPHETPQGIVPELKQVFEQSREPVLILPAEDPYAETRYLLWSTDGFPLLANGNSGNFPPQYRDIIKVTKFFPSAFSVEVLKKYGIRKVVLLKVAALKTEYAKALDRSVDGLPLVMTDLHDIVIYDLK